MVKKLKSLLSQVQDIAHVWPQFEVALGPGPNSVVWFGPLKGLDRPFTLSIEYGLPVSGLVQRHRLFPVVRVLRPSLVLNFDADDEAPLPHVYFEGPDYRLSPLCLFDPMANEWNPSMSIAKTTVPWAARWLACYELWEATGRWHGGGRHMTQEAPNDVA
ncbi:MAG: hypothetical protein ACT4OK_00755 [Gemmobacter sp.]